MMNDKAGNLNREHELISLCSRIFLEDIHAKIERHFREEEDMRKLSWTEDDLVEELFPD